MIITADLEVTDMTRIHVFLKNYSFRHWALYKGSKLHRK